jgi:hypothetical protein
MKNEKKPHHYSLHGSWSWMQNLTHSIGLDREPLSKSINLINIAAIIIGKNMLASTNKK